MSQEWKQTDGFKSHVRRTVLFLDPQSRVTANRLAVAVERFNRAKSDKSKASAQRKLEEMNDELVTACHRNPQMWNVVKSIKTKFYF